MDSAPLCRLLCPGEVILGAGVTRGSLLPWAAPLYSRGGPVGCGPVAEAASPSPLPLTSGSKGAVSSGISAICCRDPGPAEGFNPAQGRASLSIPVFGSTPAAGDSPLPGDRGTSGAPRGAGFGDRDPHQSPLVTSHAEAARLCLD